MSSGRMIAGRISKLSSGPSVVRRTCGQQIEHWTWLRPLSLVFTARGGLPPEAPRAAPAERVLSAIEHRHTPERAGRVAAQPVTSGGWRDRDASAGAGHQASILQNEATVTPECAQGVSSMRIKGKRLPTRSEMTVVALVRDEDRFEAVVAPAPRDAPGTDELRYLWNRKPFISGVFQRIDLLHSACLCEGVAR